MSARHLCSARANCANPILGTTERACTTSLDCMYLQGAVVRIVCIFSVVLPASDFSPSISRHSRPIHTCFAVHLHLGYVMAISPRDYQGSSDGRVYLGRNAQDLAEAAWRLGRGGRGNRQYRDGQGGSDAEKGHTITYSQPLIPICVCHLRLRLHRSMYPSMRLKLASLSSSWQRRRTQSLSVKTCTRSTLTLARVCVLVYRKSVPA